MSKIYEALRQAELDRAQRNANPNQTSSPAAQAVMDAPAAFEEPVAVAPAPPPVERPIIRPAAPVAVEPIAVAPVAPAPIVAAPVTPAPKPVAAPEPTSVAAAAPVAQPEPPAYRAPAPVAPAPAPPVFTRMTPPAPAAWTPEPEPARMAEFARIPAPNFDSPLLDLGGVNTYVWRPIQSQLPALEETGATVEQFRSLRSRMYEFRDLNALKSILVSSGLPQEGKSFIAANLAISFARHKAGKVLLIDGDMRRAALHKILGAPAGPGLTEYLAGKAGISDIIQRPAPNAPGNPLPHGLATLSFIPGGNEGEKAADLSGNHRFDRLIAEVAPFFDWIIVDSSPVNLVSDGINLAHACDAVLLVARGGVTKFEAAQRALTELKASKILGYVLNAVPDPPSAGGYYGYDGYQGYDKPAE